MAILSGVFQFLHSKLTIAHTPTSPAVKSGQGLDFSAMSKQMLYFFPIMIIIIGWKLPAGLVLYWAVSTLFSVGEQFYIHKTVHKNSPAKL